MDKDSPFIKALLPGGQVKQVGVGGGGGVQGLPPDKPQTAPAPGAPVLPNNKVSVSMS